MSRLNRFDIAFVSAAFLIQIALVAFFALRKGNFQLAMRIGWLVYALAVPAVLVSLALLTARRPWFFWVAGFLYAAWALYGYIVDVARPVSWRSPILWPVFVSYVLLYLSCQVFYWWPLARVQRPLWFVYAVLFVASTTLNVSSHV